MKLLAACCLSLFACLASTVHANTEKTIFITPPADRLPTSLQNSRLETITPQDSKLRKALPVAFPTAAGSDKRPGKISWYILTNLNPNQRYEVRICWTAIQPTEFWLDTYETPEILKDPLLEQQLLQFEQTALTSGKRVKPDHGTGHLLLRVIAAADFYTTNRTLMQYPPPVDVDIILDPYLANIFPQSLLPTAAYILVLATVSWPVSQLVWSLLSTRRQAEKSHAS